MLTSNPFAELSAFLPAVAMQAYIVVMVLAVVAGTVADMVHKQSGTYFTRRRKAAAESATKKIGAGDRFSMLLKTLLVEVAVAGEFCNVQRRISHILMFYGFIIYLVATIMLVFGGGESTMLPLMWHAGVILVMLGGYWFFFLLRVNVVRDGQPLFRFVLADLFIVTLLGSVTFALAWSWLQSSGNVMGGRLAFGLYILFSTLLFGTVRWSKLAHMFFKPAVAYQRRVEEASGASAMPPSVAGNERS